MSADRPSAGDPASLVRRFYHLRRNGEPEALRPLIAPDVVWCEPEVGDHMGELQGVDAVIDMMTRALSTTGGSFELDLGAIIATANACSVVVHWRALKEGQSIQGRELAVFAFEDGRIREACFFPEDIADDRHFWT